MLLPVNFLKGISVPQVNTNFEFTINTANVSTGSTANNQFRIPLLSGSIVDFTVYWGDGISNIITVWNSPLLTHTYATPGIYNVKIEGTIRGLRFAGTGDRNKLLNISNFGTKFYVTGHATSTFLGGRFFNGCNNLTITATDAPIFVTTNISRMFDSCTSLINPDFSNWNTSGIIRMTGMFRTCFNFNGNISSWDTSSVEYMDSMFFSAWSFNQPLNNWNTSNVRYMVSMFEDATSFNQPLNLWNTSNVLDTGMMFRNATSFNQPLNLWDTTNVMYMYSMFEGAESFNSNISSWNVTGVQEMDNMFKNAIAFNQPLNDWNTFSLFKMESIFEGATSFNQNIGNWNVSNVIDDIVTFLPPSFFAGATSFNNGGSPDIGNWDLASLQDFSLIFSGATSFNQPLTNWSFNNRYVADAMFYNATSFNQNISNLVPYNSDYGEFYMYDFLEGATSFTSANLDAYYNGCLNYYVTNGLSMSYVEFSAGTIKYTSASSAARASLIANYGWIIIDGGPA